ncbi:MAG: hypothetical protein NVSMB27_26020 [Ktedonobacteraceae bacterium]
MRLKEMFQWQTTAGQPVVVNDITLIPQSQELCVHVPLGTFVWRRPIAMLVERDGQVEHLPIVDRTRMLQLVLLGLSIVITLVVRLVTFTRKKEKGS